MVDNHSRRNCSDSEDDGDDFDDDDESTYEDFQQEKTYTAIIVDTSEEMFGETDTNESPIVTCLKAVHNLIDNVITSNVSIEKINLALYLGTKLIIDSETESIDCYKITRDLSSKSRDELAKEYETKTNDGHFVDNIGKVLTWFGKNCDTEQTKIVYYLTNVDNPLLDDDVADKNRLVAMNEATKFNDLNVQFNLLTLNRDFNRELFYDEFLKIANNKGNVIFATDEQDVVRQLFDYHSYRTIRKVKIKFYLANSRRNVWIDLYRMNLVGSSRLKWNILVTKTTCEEVVKLSRSNDDCVANDDVGATASGSDMNSQTGKKYAIKSPDKDDLEVIYLDDEQLNELNRNDYAVGITLLRTSKRLSRDGHSLKQCYFVYAATKKGEDSTNVDNSTKLYNSIWSYCHENERVLLCYYKATGRTTNVEYVEMTPVIYNKMAVFRVITLPTLDDLLYAVKRNDGDKDESKVNMTDVDDSLSSLVARFHDKMTRNYNPEELYDAQQRRTVQYVKSRLLDVPENEEEGEEPFQHFTGLDETDPIYEELLSHFNRLKCDKGTKGIKRKRND